MNSSQVCDYSSRGANDIRDWIVAVRTQGYSFETPEKADIKYSIRKPLI